MTVRMFSLVFSCHYVEFLTIFSLSVFLFFHHGTEFYSSHLSSPLLSNYPLLSCLLCLLFVFCLLVPPIRSLSRFSIPFNTSISTFRSAIIFSLSSPLLFNQSPHYLFLRVFLPLNCTVFYNALLLQYEYESLSVLRIYDNCYSHSLHFSVLPFFNAD
jgi:hypothetical protein